MATTYDAQASITITASPEAVWQALTDPTMVKQYLFGTEIITDWQVGSPITYKGEWQGKQYEDKGQVLAFEPYRQIQSTYWSSMSSLEDKPKNYNTVTYQLTPQAEQTVLTISQTNNSTPEARDHSAQNWQMVLEGLKKLVESN